MCLLYGMVLGSLANPICGRWRGGDGTVTSQWDWRFPKSSRGSENNVDDIVYFCGNFCSGRWGYFVIGEHLLPTFLQGMIGGFHDLLMDSYRPFSCRWGVAQSMFSSRAGFSGWDAGGIEHN